MPRRHHANGFDEQIKDQTFSDLQALIAESERLLKDSAQLVGKDAEQLRDEVGDKLRQARLSLGQIGERTRPAIEATSQYIAGHPWQTVAASAAFGLVIGLLLGRRN